MALQAYTHDRLFFNGAEVEYTKKHLHGGGCSFGVYIIKRTEINVKFTISQLM